MIDINEIKIAREYKYMYEIFNYTLRYDNILISIGTVDKRKKTILLKVTFIYNKFIRSYGNANKLNIPKKYKDIIKDLFDLYESMIIIPNNLCNIYGQYSNYKIDNYLKENILNIFFFL